MRTTVELPDELFREQRLVQLYKAVPLRTWSPMV